MAQVCFIHADRGQMHLRNLQLNALRTFEAAARRLSFKEAAAVRDTSERTVREQARSLYKKAGLAGRSELSAFFLEDLLLPREESGSPG